MKNYSAIWVHIVWTTENRMPLLSKEFRRELFKFMKRNSSAKGFMVDTVNGIEDHVHSLARLKPTQPLSKVVKQLKGSSSRWVNKKNLLKVRFAWQVGYGALSVSPSDIDKVRKYIINQEKHHRKWNLEKELGRFQFYN